MRKLKIGFNLKNKRISLEVFKVPWWYEGIGLMFCFKKNAKALLFEFEKKTKISLHSFFVFFDFYAIWLDDKNAIIEIKRIKPFKLFIMPKKSFSRVIEIPVNKKYLDVLKLIDGSSKDLNRL